MGSRKKIVYPICAVGCCILLFMCVANVDRWAIAYTNGRYKEPAYSESRCAVLNTWLDATKFIESRSKGKIDRFSFYASHWLEHEGSNTTCHKSSALLRKKKKWSRVHPESVTVFLHMTAVRYIWRWDVLSLLSADRGRPTCYQEVSTVQYDTSAKLVRRGTIGKEQCGMERRPMGATQLDRFSCCADSS